MIFNKRRTKPTKAERLRRRAERERVEKEEAEKLATARQDIEAMFPEYRPSGVIVMPPKKIVRVGMRVR